MVYYMIDGKSKLLAITSHCGYLLLGVGYILIPLIIYLVYDEKNPFVANHAKQAFKAQAIIGIMSLIASILTFFIVGLIFWPFIIIIALLWLCCSFFACYRVINGQEYHYPLL